MEKEHKFEIWCQLILSQKSQKDIYNFFSRSYYIDSKFLIKNLHLTVYHSRRPMFSLEEQEVKCNYVLDTNDSRFMVLAPGGENSRPELVPADKKVGIRIKKQSELRSVIDKYRNEVLIHENQSVLGSRKPSNRVRNAFGSRYFQPHISILKAGSGIITDLNIVGDDFRDFVPEISFDRYVIKRKQLK